MDMSQGSSGPGPKPDDATNDDAENQDDDPMEVKEDETSRLDLGALEKDLLEYQFSEDNDIGEADETLLLMTPSSFMSPTEEAPASLSPVDLVYLALDSRRRDAHNLFHESPRRRSIDKILKGSFLGTFSEEEYERYQSELQRKTGVTCNRVAFMEKT